MRDGAGARQLTTSRFASGRLRHILLMAAVTSKDSRSGSVHFDNNGRRMLCEQRGQGEASAKEPACKETRSRSAAALLVVSLLLTACEIPSLTGCDAFAAPGLAITVRDSASGAPVNDSVRVVARSGTYADSIDGSSFGNGSFALAYERAGLYSVTVTHPRARTWERTGVRVREDRCHVIPTQVNARLQMQP